MGTVASAGRLLLCAWLGWCGLTAGRADDDDDPPPVLIPAGRQHGLALGGSYTAEFLANVHGGLHTGAAYDGLLQLNLDVDFQKLVKWPGAALHVSVIDPHGPSLSDRYVGDYTGVSGIDAYDSLRLYATWFQQSLGDDRFALRVGFLVADEQFAVLDAAQLFINSSFGTPSAFALRFPLSSYPYAAPAAQLKVVPAKHWTVLFGAFDGNPAPGVLADPSPGAAASTEFNHWGSHFALRREEGAMLFAEVGWHSGGDEDEGEKREGDSGKKEAAVEDPLQWAFKLGGTYHTDRFANIYDATLQDLESPGAPARARGYEGNYAIYAQAECELWREPGTDQDGLTGFARLTYAPPDRNIFVTSVEAGFVYRGLWQEKARDTLGLGVVWENTSPRFSSAVRDSGTGLGRDETVIELTYRRELTRFWTMQPDLQWVLNPGGRADHALVLGMHSTIRF